MAHDLAYYRATTPRALVQYVDEIAPLTRDPLTQALAEKLEKLMDELVDKQAELTEARDGG